tara:strand:- start:214 stop:375 length:162 start_codon:yes stop_codon:yes gene_type:complete
MEIEHFILGFTAVLPLLSGMPLGAFLLKNASATLFDKVILFILVGVAMKLLFV